MRYEVVIAKAATELRALPVVARDVLKLCDGTRTLDAICARSSLPHERTRQVVRRLERLGMIVRRETVEALEMARRPIAPATTAWIEGTPPPVEFSAEEESFFSQSIDHLVEDEYA